MEYPFFSIIIPTYNSAVTLATCLDCILGQSFKNIEVLIVDGNSKDCTIAIVKEYAGNHQNIKWISENDNGIYDAMNKGIRMAKGEWLYFLGSDDTLHDIVTLQQVHDIDKQGFNVIYGNARIVGDTSWSKNGDLYDGIFNLEKLLKKNVCHQAIFYNKKSFLPTSPIFNTNYKLCADYDFNLRCWAKQSFLFIDIVIADFYGGGESTKNDSDAKFSADFEKNFLNNFGLSIYKKYFGNKPVIFKNYSFRLFVVWIKKLIRTNNLNNL